MSDHDERWVLDHLVGMCRDDEHTLRFAAEHVGDPSVRALLGQLADERARFAEELLPHARRLGGGSAEITEGTWKGAVHQRWLTLKERVVGHSERTMVEEAERGEQQTVDSFEEALSGMLPPTVRDLVESQYVAARAGRERLRALGTP